MLYTSVISFRRDFAHDLKSARVVVEVMFKERSKQKPLTKPFNRRVIRLDCPSSECRIPQA